MTACDMIVQLTICYICFTMGLSEQLRRFKMTLDFKQGAVRIVFNLIKEDSNVEAQESVEEV